MLYDLVQCPHRVSRDLFDDPGDRDPVNAFVELLWKRGNAFEAEVMASSEVPFLDLKDLPTADKEQQTLDAMARNEPLIYGGRIVAGDLLGEPDLLRFADGAYIAGDIKSGAGEEGASEDKDGKPKKHYAVQLALYIDVLEQIGRSAGRRAFVWDIHGEEIEYDLTSARGPRTPQTMWEEYEDARDQVRRIVAQQTGTLPAYGSGTCKLCHWYSSCLRQLEASDDLSLLSEVGRAKRDAMLDHVQNRHDMAAADISTLPKMPGIGAKSIQKFHDRAVLCTTPNAQPYLREPVALPDRHVELFFDVETDPMRDICYLHGFVVREGGDCDAERFEAFFSDDCSEASERQAFANAWEFVGDCHLNP